MARRSQPYRLEWPHSAEQQEHIDEMFQLLFDDTENGSIDVSADQIVDGVLAVPRGGTGLSEYVIGDLLVAVAEDELGTIADVATGYALISGGVGVIPSWGKIDLTTHVEDVLPVANGGTGISSYAIGDLLYASGSTTLAKLADVAAGSYLRSGGVTTAPLWSTLALPNASAQGDIFISTAANVMTVLAKNTTATRYLANTGASNNPAWDQVNLANGVTGTLPVANGGTNAGAFTAGSIVFAGASGTYTQDNANLFWDDSNNRLGVGTTTPIGPIQIQSDSDGSIYVYHFVSNTTGPGLRTLKGRNTGAAPRRAKSGDSLMIANAVGAYAVDDATTATLTGSPVGAFRFVASEDHTATARGTYWFVGTTDIGSTTLIERIRITAPGHMILPELSADPGTGDLTADAAIAIYTKNDKLVFAYNNGGTITYITIPLDGSTTTLTHNTTTP